MRSMDKDRNRAVGAVVARLSQLEATTGRIASEAGISENTLRDFLAGKTWPIVRTLGRIEKVIGWPPGSIESIANGGPIPKLATEAEESTREHRPATAPVTEDVEPEIMTAIVRGGVKITMSPAAGYSMKDVLANMGLIAEAISDVVRAVDPQPDSASGEPRQR
jgi:predicted transcriptional regulator